MDGRTGILEETGQDMAAGIGGGSVCCFSVCSGVFAAFWIQSFFFGIGAARWGTIDPGIGGALPGTRLPGSASGQQILADRSGAESHGSGFGQCKRAEAGKIRA